MSYRILILGASYGSLLGTKLLMAGHDVSLVCRASTAQLINDEGTDVRIRLRGEDEPPKHPLRRISPAVSTR
jgi:ketopantoate reductase